MIRTLAALAAVLVLAPHSSAETFPVQSQDPHMSSWGVRGTFVLERFGTLDNGTACPAGANAMPYRLSGTSGEQFLTSFGLHKETTPELDAAFDDICRIAFTGEVKLFVHHGRHASILPTALVGVTVGSAEVEDPPEGQARLIRMTYQPIICIRAPCPQGDYNITLDGGPPLRVPVIQFEDHSLSPPVVRKFEGAYLPFEEIEGRLAIEGDIAIIAFGN